MKDSLPFNFRMLETFVAVADSEGMTAAAKRLGWSQSAVSQTISSLERDLECTLIKRQGKTITLTSAGEMFYQHALDILTRARKLVRQMDSEGSNRIPSIRIGMVDSVAATIGTGLVRRLYEFSGNIKVHSGIAPYLHEKFNRGELDMVITMGPNLPPENGVMTRVLLEAYLLALPKNYGNTVVRLEKLCRELPLLRFTDSSLSRGWTENYLRRLNLKPDNIFEFDSSTALMAMVSEGIGWTIISPLCLVQASEHLVAARLVPLKEPGYYRELQLIHRTEMNSVIVRQTLEAIEELLNAQIPIMQRHIPWFSAQHFQVRSHME